MWVVAATAGRRYESRTSHCDDVDIFSQNATPGIAATAKKAPIYKERRFCTLAPLTIDYDI